MIAAAAMIRQTVSSTDNKNKNNNNINNNNHDKCKNLTHGAAADNIDAVRRPIGVGDFGVRGDGHALAVNTEGIDVALEIHLVFPTRSFLFLTYMTAF